MSNDILALWIQKQHKETAGMIGGDDDDRRNDKVKTKRANCRKVKVLQSIEEEEINVVLMQSFVKWQSIGGNGPNINHLLISGWSGEKKGYEKREIPQLVLHPSSVWTGCQLDTGNICWLIFSTGWRVLSDVRWIRNVSSEILRFTTLQTWKVLRTKKCGSVCRGLLPSVTSSLRMCVVQCCWLNMQDEVNDPYLSRRRCGCWICTETWRNWGVSRAVVRLTDRVSISVTRVTTSAMGDHCSAEMSHCPTNGTVDRLAFNPQLFLILPASLRLFLSHTFAPCQASG